MTALIPITKILSGSPPGPVHSHTLGKELPCPTTRQSKPKPFRTSKDDVCNLVRWGDITLSLCEQEMLEGIKITADGNVSVVALQHLVGLIKDLKKDYYAAYHA
jgi:hypothetical protein